MRIIEGCQQITGLLHGTMSRGTAYQFIRVGRNLERADMTTRIIDVAAATLLTGRRELLRFDNRLWMSVLQSLGAYQMYRQHVRRRIMGPDVIAYLLKDELFPRALNHCLRELKAALAAFPGHDSSLDSIGAVEALVLGLALEDIGVQRLHQWIDDVQLALGDLDGRIHGHWFLPAAVG